MGLIEETMKMRRNQEELLKNQKEVEDLEKQIEAKKQAEKEEKLYNKDLSKAYEKDLRSIFLNHFERDGLKRAYINLRLKGYRDGIIGLDDIDGIKITYEERDYWDDNYEKILEKTKKIYENDQKAQNELIEIAIEQQKAKLLEEERQKEEKEQQEKESKEIWKSCVAMFFVFIFLFFFVFCLTINKIWLFIVVSIVLSILLSIITAFIKLFKD